MKMFENVNIKMKKGNNSTQFFKKNPYVKRGCRVAKDKQTHRKKPSLPSF